MTLKRQFADFIERALDLHVIRRGALATLFEQEHLARFFKHFDIDCVFDVGANGGQYAEMIRARCGFRGPIISFEPLPNLASFLKNKASDNWFIEPIALDEMAGDVTFNVAANDQFSSLNQPEEHGRFERHSATVQRLTIATSTLAEQFDKYQKLIGFRRPFLKMDTQGSDLPIARGAGDRLSRFVGIQSELSYDPIYKDVPLATEALEFFRSKGFVLSAMVPNNAGHFPHLYEIDCILYRATN